jgi:hypothetical protein
MCRDESRKKQADKPQCNRMRERQDEQKNGSRYKAQIGAANLNVHEFRTVQILATVRSRGAIKRDCAEYSGAHRVSISLIAVSSVIMDSHN